MKVSDFIAKRFEEYVDHVFLVAGGGCIHLVDSFSKSKIKIIPTLHEQGAAICAESYAQYTNKLGLVLTTTGPGATNALTGIASAWLDSVPVIMLTGQVQTCDRIKDRGVRQMGFQEIDAAAIYNPITKWAVTVTEPSNIDWYIDMAIAIATQGRPGPVLLEIPLDIQSAEIDKTRFTKNIIYPNDSKIIDYDNIIKLLNRAKRPILLAGNGIRLSKAMPEFYEFIEKTGIPVLTTWKFMDALEEDHPQYVGRPGGFGQRGANFNQQNSDFIITIGARLDHGQLAYQPKFFAREAVKCIVDVDRAEIIKLGTYIDFPVVQDAKEFLTKMNKKVTKLSISSWLEFCKNLYKKYPVVNADHLNHNNSYVNLYAFIEYLSELLSNDSLIIPGSSGTCSEVTMQALKVKKGFRVYNSQGLGAMGFGIPAAVGGCIASNNKPTICIDGDGGMFMNVQELELIKRYNLPIKLFIINNNGYGAIRTSQKNYFNNHLVACDLSSGLSLPSIELTSNAYQIPYTKIIDQKNLKEDIFKVLSIEGPVICELMVDPNHTTLPRASVYKNEKGGFETAPMENMIPFLERTEFMENLLIKPVYE